MKIFSFLLVGLYVVSGCAPTPANEEPAATSTAVEEAPPVPIAYQLIKEYPHDAGAFTQGLVWYQQYLMEGTGQFEQSNVRRVELATGKVKQQVNNTNEIFGEGITVLGGKLYQITWKNKIGYVYDAATLKLEREFAINTEGWGLTNNGTELILSDGSSNLYFLDPTTLKETRRLGVFDNMGPRVFINELEYIKGFVYANIWQTDFIIKIDPASGKIVGRADLSDLRGKTGIPRLTGEEGTPEVLNGIAYDSAANRIFITGKNWPKLFEIKLDN